MEDFFDDFDDDFDNGDFMDEDIFEDNIEEDLETDEPFDDDPVQEDEPYETHSKDSEFTTKEAFFLGSFFGFAYEEALKKRKQRKGKKFSDNSK